MCTVTIIPQGGDGSTSGRGLRMVCNRDESPRRAAALPPRTVEQRSVRWLMPVDPPSRGTWIAASDTGLVVTVLNLNPPHDPPGATHAHRSRGELVPRVIVGGDFDTACDIAETIQPHRHRPFRLVIADAHHLAVVAGDGHRLTLDHQPMPRRPWMITSSGLGDQLVEPPRRELFDGWFSPTMRHWPAEQDAFHLHRWDDRPQLSVCMKRDGAQTVSMTVVEMDGRRVSMRYHGAPPDVPTEDVSATLDTQAEVNR